MFVAGLGFGSDESGGGVVGKPDPLAKPVGEAGFVEKQRPSSCCPIGVRWLGCPVSAVEVDEHERCGPGGALAAPRERMTPGQPTREHGGVVVEVGVEVVVAEAGPRVYAGRRRRTRRG
jgi:hypothetical protein